MSGSCSSASAAVARLLVHRHQFGFILAHFSLPLRAGDRLHPRNDVVDSEMLDARAATSREEVWRVK